jgi:hypothetical protein
MRSRKKLTRCGSTSAVDDEEVRAGGEGARQSWRDQLAERIIELAKASERNPNLLYEGVASKGSAAATTVNGLPADVRSNRHSKYSCGGTRTRSA